jgi:Mg-chelatase subunit ChlD
VSFNEPWLLLLLLALPFIGWLGWKHRSPARLRRDSASIALRALIALLIVLSLAGASRVQSSGGLDVVFLLDASDSVGQEARDKALAFVRESLAAMPPGDRAGLILFGADALVERPVVADVGLPDPASAPLRAYTDIAGAIRLGLALFPGDAARRLVLLSDGQANLGDARSAAQLAAASGAQLLAVPLAPEVGYEARLESLSAPATLHQGERFDLALQVQASAAMTAALRVFADGRLVAGEALALQKGLNTFRLPLTAGGPGFTTFRAQLVPARDTFPQNNELDAFSIVRGPLRVLLVAGERPEGENLRRALLAAGLTVDEAEPGQMPADAGSLGEYAAVVLVNVPSFELSPRQLKLLQAYVRDLGHGLLVVGGDSSYGPGGYFQTPLEETLPVEMALKDKERLPGMTMLMVIDKSGSMENSGTPGGGGPRKVELAKEAIYRSLDLLGPWDRAGVIAFDNAARWVVRPTYVADVGAIKDAVGTIRASGGTDIYAGMKLAAEAMAGEQSRVKHIVLLTDGGASPEGIPELVRGLREQEVSTSVVAIGEGYAPFLVDLADIGGGRFHFAADATVIPQIFAQEATLASRAYIIEETFTPRLASVSPILQGIEAVPPLRGYVGTTPKLTAQVVLVSDKDDPLLAQWQYGLGRAVAWTSDAKGQWAADWLEWAEFPRFWAQAVRWTIVEGTGGGLETQVRLEGARAVVSVEALDEKGDYRNGLELGLSTLAPSLKSQEIALRQVAPGLYEGEFSPQEAGTYLLRVHGSAPDGTALAQTGGFVLAYSPEYRATGADMSLLAGLAEIGRGELINDAGKVFAHTLPPVSRASELWPWLLAIALCLLPLDVGLRRLTVTRRDLREMWERLARRLPQRRPAPPAPSGLERLMAAKERSGKERRKPELPPIPPPAAAPPAEPGKPKPAEEVKPETVQHLLRSKRERKK